MTGKTHIVIPAWNAEKFLAFTLESLIQQKVKNWVAVVVNDGSIDSTRDIAEKYARDDHRIKVQNQTNQGPSAARAAGCAHLDVDTEYLYFLDADDVLEDHALSIAIEYLCRRDNVVLVHFACTSIDECGNSISDDAVDFTPMRNKRLIPCALWAREIAANDPVTPFSAIYNLAGIIPSTALMRRSAFERCGGWDVTLPQGYEDTDLWLRLALEGEVHFLPKTLLRYRRHSTQSTSKTGHQELYSVRYQNLIDKWNSIEGLSESQRKLVFEAEVFRRRGLKVYRNAEIACHSLRNGRLIDALRHTYGAGRALLGIAGN